MLDAHSIILNESCLRCLLPYALCLPQSLVQAFLTLAVHNSSKHLPGLQVGSAVTVGAPSSLLCQTMTVSGVTQQWGSAYGAS